MFFAQWSSARPCRAWATRRASVRGRRSARSSSSRVLAATTWVARARRRSKAAECPQRPSTARPTPSGRTYRTTATVSPLFHRETFKSTVDYQSPCICTYLEFSLDIETLTSTVDDLLYRTCSGGVQCRARLAGRGREHVVVGVRRRSDVQLRAPFIFLKPIVR